MRAALAARVNYMDLGGLYHMTNKQLALDREFRRIGKLAIAGMGGAPGITNVMARALADPLDRVDAIHVYNAGADEQRYDSPIAYTFSIATILDELTMPPVAFVSGRYVEKAMLSDAGDGHVSRADRQNRVATFDSFRAGHAGRKLSQRKACARYSLRSITTRKLVGLVRTLVETGFTRSRTDRRKRHAGGAASRAAGTAAEESCRRRRRATWKLCASWSLGARASAAIGCGHGNVGGSSPTGRSFRPSRATPVFRPRLPP